MDKEEHLETTVTQIGSLWPSDSDVRELKKLADRFLTVKDNRNVSDVLLDIICAIKEAYDIGFNSGVAQRQKRMEENKKWQQLDNC